MLTYKTGKNKSNAETRDSLGLMRALRNLNQGPLDLQSNALPTELFRQLKLRRPKPDVENSTIFRGKHLQ